MPELQNVSTKTFHVQLEQATVFVDSYTGYLSAYTTRLGMSKIVTIFYSYFVFYATYTNQLLTLFGSGYFFYLPPNRHASRVTVK